jgi:hypothetical protein
MIQIAVCLCPGTVIAFEQNVFAEGMIFRKTSTTGWRDSVSIDLDKPTHQHDALEFSNGTIVLVTDLAPGQKSNGPAIARRKAHRKVRWTGAS